MKNQLSLLAVSLLASTAFVACEISEGDDNHIDDDVGGADMGDGDGDGDGDGTGGNSNTGVGGMGGDTGSGGMPDALECEPPPFPAEVIEIEGAYNDETQGGEVVITDSSWDTGFTFHHLSEVSNEGKYAVALNDADNVFAPCLWSLFIWHEEAGTLYYCQAALDAPTESDAALADLPDETDLATGCDGFPWNELTPL